MRARVDRAPPRLRQGIQALDSIVLSTGAIHCRTESFDNKKVTGYLGISN
ncbi:hypothetical protein LMG29542_02990 [Paraburkholderia humisilvae]|uniref:Uncharacterized protein n=1 Tax=Paraburkholderia humisilvae TaxID=627669 RepID=A0A6J5DTW0_9BURK|nr:hypothetical protein LMG29542_02990 [Paraburkholderia humisilvae]